MREFPYATWFHGMLYNAQRGVADSDHSKHEHASVGCFDAFNFSSSALAGLVSSAREVPICTADLHLAMQDCKSSSVVA